MHSSVVKIDHQPVKKPCQLSNGSHYLGQTTIVDINDHDSYWEEEGATHSQWVGPDLSEATNPALEKNWVYHSLGCTHVSSKLGAMISGISPRSEPPVWALIRMTSWLLNDMLSTSLLDRILKHGHPLGFVVPKFTMYDDTFDPFDHLMHYQQVITLDIDNHLLLCKVFPGSPHGSTSS